MIVCWRGCCPLNWVVTEDVSYELLLSDANLSGGREVHSHSHVRYFWAVMDVHRSVCFTQSFV